MVYVSLLEFFFWLGLKSFGLRGFGPGLDNFA